LNSNSRSDLVSQPQNLVRQSSDGLRLNQRQARMIEAVVSATCSMTPLAVALVLGVKQVVAA
jgi:hypothetical protein